ncbi:MAG: PQQ-binding-like beta-propeller repeat protein [Myxococcales bacterium]|nr:PQQ-binding-like beta-propeller repeat protein [Myxococcales bacterium]
MDQPTTRTKRVRGRFVVIGLIALVASVATFALTMWFGGREPRGPIQAMRPLGGGEVALLRRGFEERGYTHLVVWSIERGQHWSEALFGVPEHPSLTHVRQGEVDLVALRAREARGHVEIHAFDRRTGRFAWRGGRATHENPTEHPGGLPAFAERSLLVGDGVLFVVHGGDAVEVVILGLEDGEERARVELPADPEGADAARSAAVVEGALIVSTGSSVHRVGPDGAHARLGSTALGHCVTSAHVFFGDPGGLRVHHGDEVQVLGDGFAMEVYACAERANAEGVREAWIVARAPSGDRVLQRYEGQLRGGFSLPELAQVDRLLDGPEGLLLVAGGALWRVGEENARVEEGIDDVWVVGGEVVTRMAETLRAGANAVRVPGATLVAADTLLWVATERELVALEGDLSPRFGGERVQPGAAR